MGQKVNPKSIKTLLNKQWDSRWISGNLYAYNLLADTIIRDAILKKLGKMGIEKITVERGNQETMITIHSSRPGSIIGRSGKGIVELKKYILNYYDKKQNDFRLINSRVESKKITEIRKKLISNLKINISEIRNNELRAQLIALDIVNQLEKRMPYRKVIKRIISKLTSNRDLLGIKIKVAGRLGGVDIARKEKFSHGSIPLSTLSSNVDYAYVPANTTHGMIGVKVWLYTKDNKKNK